MLKVFLVDDESIVISDLCTLVDWKACGFEIVGWAYSAEQAMKQIPEKRPDVVFMDVSLPSMDGLELSEQLRKKLPDLMVIILSGYRDFSYAQRAINLGVLTYLVKHELTPEKLTEVLKKATAEHRKKKGQEKLMRRQLLSDLCTGKESWDRISAERKGLLRGYENKKIFALLVSWFQPIFRPQESIAPRMEEKVEQAALDCGFLCLDAVPVEERVFLTMEFSPGEKLKTEKSLQRLALSLEEESRCFISYLFQESAPSQLAENYRLLREASEKGIFCQNSQAEAAGVREQPTEEIDFSFLRPTLLSKDFDSFERQLSDCFGEIIGHRDLKGFWECISKLEALSDSLPGCPVREELRELEARSAQEVRSQLLKRFGEYHRGRSGNQSYSAITNFVLEYIKKNYNQSPSLQEAADALNSNSMYVGQKFKKETGKGFHDYLAEYRIRLAQDMLAHTNLKIFEIAEETGIHNSQYFSKTFKEITGLTPVEYRNRFYQARS